MNRLPIALLALMAACSPEPEPEPTPAPIEEIMATELNDLKAFADEQIGCLARTAYFEARGEGQDGMAGVIYVVINRTESFSYPDEPCAVIEQRNNSGCQFSWMCDGKSDQPTNKAAYDKALKVARAAAAGILPDPTDGAVMFHASRVTPYWTEVADRTTEIGSHVFYRLDE